MREYIIEADELEFCYPDGTKALDNVSLKIKSGSRVVLLGSNGAGKSTLFLHFNGVLKPRRGKIRFEGKEVKYDSKSLLNLRKDVGIVFQDPDVQLFSSSVFQEISFGPLNIGLSPSEVHRRVLQAMEDTGISDLQDKPTHFLSYGQKKCVSIADILAMEPKVLICDEPSAWLDPKHSRQIEQLFNNINEKGTTVIISTHDVDLAYSWADYVFVMKDGQLIGQGEPYEVFADELLLRKASLERPWIIDITNALIEKGLLSDNELKPKNRKELLKVIGQVKVSGGVEIHNDFSNIWDQGRDRTYSTVSREGK